VIPGEQVRLGDHYYIRASSVAADLPKLVLKHDDAFFVADVRGDFPAIPDSEFGFYVEDTRYLQTLQLLVNGDRPLLLSAATTDDAVQIAVDLTNPDQPAGEGTNRHVGRSIHLARRLTLQGSQFCQLVSVDTFSGAPHEIELAFRFDSDFADVFEVRGFARERRGELLSPAVEADAVRLGYRGLDGALRTTQITFDPRPDRLDSVAAQYRLRLLPGRPVEICLTASAAHADDQPGPGMAAPAAAPTSTGECRGTALEFPRLPSIHDRPGGYGEVLTRRARAGEQWLQRETQIRTSHEQVNQWIERSRVDLRMLATATADGRIPYAGIPWYVAPFGRDSLITTFQLLPFDAAMARGTLRFLAHHQGQIEDRFTDQEPGKILHEFRRGELAACRDIVFIPYYGSVDATPLFVMLLAEYLRWTADLGFATELWPAAQRALAWLRRQLAEGTDLAYECRSSRGLVNQGWKDSFDAIMHASGALAPAPIALVEAQGYAYAALEGGAELAALLGDTTLAGELSQEAQRLQRRFEAAYWMDKEDFYALARDGTGAPCQVITSNPGHCLWTGLIAPDRAKKIAQRMMGSEMFSGWGLRTLAMGERRYNPMSYHNGSVWPHDTAIAAAGFRRYGLTEPFFTLATGLFESVLHYNGLRMPELFCGFGRVPGQGPVRYPAACSPQAWSSGAVFHLLTAMLGLQPEARDNRLTLNEPVLPSWLRWVEVYGLAIRESTVDLRLSSGRHGAAVELLDRRGDAEVVVRR
jgi:glycogen debranching enzyme